MQNTLGILIRNRVRSYWYISSIFVQTLYDVLKRKTGHVTSDYIEDFSRSLSYL